MDQNDSPKRRGRPSLSQAEIAKTRAEIAQRAMALFQEEGFEAVSMRRLAREVGYTPTTLYRYFEAKIDILHMLWAQILNGLFDQLEAETNSISDPTQRLHALAWGYVSYWLEHREEYFLVFMSGGVTREDVTGFMTNADVAVRFALFQMNLSAALGKGLDASTHITRAQTLVCGLNGIAQGLITVSAYNWSAPEPLVKEVVDAALR